MKYLLIITLFFAGFDTYSCGCIELDSTKRYKADYILRAKILSKEVIKVKLNEEWIPDVYPDVYIVRYRLEVLNSFMGKPKIFSYIYSEEGSGDCGYIFEIGKEYLIYADIKRKYRNNRYFPKVPKFLHTSTCTPTRRLI